MRSHLAFPILILTTTLAAQQTTSPRGYLSKSGNALMGLGVTNPGFGKMTRQIVQIDDTQKGRAQTIKALHFRRNADIADVSWLGAHTLDVIARMGHGDYSKVVSQGQMVSTVLVGSWVDVLPATKVNFPDISKRPVKSPAPWSLRIPLKKPFVYDGKNALLFQIHAWANMSTGSYPFDAINENRVLSFGDPVGKGTGCRYAGREIEVNGDFTVLANVPAATLFVVSEPQVTNTPFMTIAILGLKNPNLTVPGLCVPVYATPDIIMPMQFPAFREDGVQGWAAVAMIPHSKSLVGARIFVQAWAANSNQGPIPLSGSYGWHTGKFPAQPTPTTAVAAYEHLGSELGTFVANASFEKGSGVIVGLEQ